VKPVELHPEADAELRSAVAYYEAQRPGLGLDLQAEVEAALRRIQLNPLLFPPTGRPPLRKCVLRRFPYTIIFAERRDRIWVSAIAHQKRKPGYWSHRRP
jgi:toxin ParE1/3/4